MKKLVIAAAIIAAGVGGVSYANYVATQEVRAEVDKQLALVSEQTGASFNYADLSASVISNSVAISNIEVTSPEGENIATVEHVEVTGYETDKISPHTAFTLKRFVQSRRRDRFNAASECRQNVELNRADPRVAAHLSVHLLPKVCRTTNAPHHAH